MALTLSQSRDTWCEDVLKPGRMATGKTLLAQRLYHRLITPAGTLKGGEEEADFGLDLAGIIGSTSDRDLGPTLPARVTNELRKDPAVDTAKVRAIREKASDGTVRWTLAIDVESDEGPFEMFVAASAVTVDLLRVS